MKDILTADRKTRLIATQIEIDLRRWIQRELLTKKNFEELVSGETYKLCLDYCIKRKKSLDEIIIREQIHDDDLLEFINFSTSLEILKKNKLLLEVNSQKLLEENYNGFVFAKGIRNTAEHGRIVTPNEAQEFIDFCEIITKDEYLFKRTHKEIEDLDKGLISDETTGVSIDEYIDEREDIHNLPKPEYEDTGWIDRKNLNIQLKKKLRNSNVISFIGDAGAGKTALAVKKCYEYLSGKIENDFESFIYHSFKTEKFSKGEIIDLQNEVNTTDKFFKSLEIINHYDDPIKNLVKHLEDYKILLLLDNLENVLDNNIINFLEKFSEADHQSKIFITSRIPIGHGDISIKVGSFTDKEAMDYFQQLSKFLQLETITRKLPEASITKLIKQRMNNPLYIKLALNSVSDGISIEDAFKDNKDLLNFSYLAIYNKLNNLSKKIIEIIYIVKRELAVSSICDLLENEDPNEVSKSIRELIRKNVLLISFKKTEAEYYSLRKEMAQFVEKNGFFNDKKRNENIFKRLTHLSVFESQIPINIKDIEDIPEGWNNFLCRKTTDRTAIHKLRKVANLIQTLNKSKNVIYAKYKDSEKTKETLENEILSIIENLKNSHDDYCEVYRVEALYYATKKNITLVKKYFDIAIALQPDYPNIYNYYSNALREVQDLKGCKENAIKAAVKFPNNGEAQQNLLIAKIYLNEYDDEIEEVYKKVDSYLHEHRGFLKSSRKIGMRLIRFHLSKADFFLTKQDYHQCLESVKNAYEKFYSLEKKNLVDSFTLSQLKKSVYLFNKLKDYYRGQNEVIIIEKLHDSLTEACTTYESLRDKGQKRALVGATIIGNIKFDKEIKGAFINFENSFVIEFGAEKTKIYIPYHLIPKNIKDESRVSFKLGKFQTNSGKHVLSANDLAIYPD